MRKQKPPHGRLNPNQFFAFHKERWFLCLIEFNSGDDLLFRGLSQSTIGDTGFPCLVRNGTEGDSRSIITRIKLNEHRVNQLQRSLQAFRSNKSNER